MFKYSIVLALSMAAAVTAPARASLISNDLEAVGDGLLTIDAATQLQWLDVDQTLGFSVSQVANSRFVSSYGFRFATAYEVETLWRNAGASGPFQYNPSGVSYAGNYAAARSLVQLMGCTSQVVGVECDDVGQNWHIARLSLSRNSLVEELAVVDYFEEPDFPSKTGAMLLDVGSSFPEFFERSDIGNYLVRAAVPEPSTFALAALALLPAFLLGASGRQGAQRADIAASQG